MRYEDGSQFSNESGPAPSFRNPIPMTVLTLQPLVWLRVAMLVLGWGLSAIAAGAPGTAKKLFDLPVDAADRSIKRFSEQAGLEVFYPSSATKGVRTQHVKGEMTAREALAAMLAGSNLRVVEDQKTGALAIVSPASSRPPTENSKEPASDLSPTAKKKAANHEVPQFRLAPDRLDRAGAVSLSHAPCRGYRWLHERPKQERNNRPREKRGHRSLS